MRRQVFDDVEVQGLGEGSQHVEACGVSFFGRSRRYMYDASPQGRPQYHRLFVGTSEGGLTAYECRSDTGKPGYELVVREQMRRGGGRGDRKSVTQLEAFEQQSLVLALIDGVLVVYDATTLRTTASATHCRGCLLFAAHAESRTVVVFQKKKAKYFAWQRGGALRDVRREASFSETPSNALCLSDHTTILVMKKEYVVMQTTASSSSGAAAVADSDSLPDAMLTRLCEASSGASVAVVVAGERLVVSAGSRGLVFDASDVDHGSFQQLDDRLAWSGTPSLCRSAVAFVVSVVGTKKNKIEIHFAPTFALVQTVDVGKAVIRMCGGGFGLAPPPSSEEQQPQQRRRQLIGESSNFGDVDEYDDDDVMSGDGRRALREAEFFCLGANNTCRLLRMKPALDQINVLVDDGAYEDALALCGAAGVAASAAYAIEARFAYALYARGDFEGAVHHWLRSSATVTPADVAALFPLLCPADLAAKLQAQSQSWLQRQDAGPPEKVDALRHPPQLRQASLSRAAAAATRYFEVVRDRLVASDTTTAAGQRRPSQRSAARGDMVDASLSMDPEKRERDWKLVDTMLVSARLLCAPPRVDDIIALLKRSDQHCELESVAPLLAAGGPNCAEPLLWLYRSKGLHSRALAMLVEDRCCGPTQDDDSDKGTGYRPWDRAKFRRWQARYVRYLWFSRHAALALETAAGLFENAPALGLAVFTGAKIETSDDVDEWIEPRFAGGDGTPAQDVVAWMKQLVLPPEPQTSSPAEEKAIHRLWRAPTFLKGDQTTSSSGGLADDMADESFLNYIWRPPVLTKEDIAQLTEYQERRKAGDPDAAKCVKIRPPENPPSQARWKADEAAADLPLALDSGNAVAVAYLEFLVSRGETLELLHNELAFLLLDGLLRVRDNKTSESLAELYRGRLRRFLRLSTRYRADQVLSWLPENLMREKALVLARLGRHDDVLLVYADELRDDALAEAYCDEVWRRAMRAQNVKYMRAKKRADAQAADLERRQRSDEAPPEAEEDYDDDDDDADTVAALKGVDVYLALATMYVKRDKQGTFGDGLDKAIDLLSRHLGRADPVKIIENVLPPRVPLYRVVDFVRLVHRYNLYAKRASEIEYQLLRVNFVNLKYDLTQQQIKQQSKIAAVPELSRLGRVKRSLPPVTLTAPEELYHVACTRHLFEHHVALQFHITNHHADHKLHNVRVKVESLGDADLYAHDAEVPLKVLPYKSTGSAYVVFKTFPTVGNIVTSFAAELRFAITQESNLDAGGTYLEEIPLLEHLELSTADM